MRSLNEILNNTWGSNNWVAGWTKYILRNIPWKSIKGSQEREKASIETHDVVFSTLRTVEETISQKTRYFTKPKFLIQ